MCSFRTVPRIDCHFFGQVNEHRKRQTLTLNQSNTTLSRSRNFKGPVFLSPDQKCPWLKHESSDQEVGKSRGPFKQRECISMITACLKRFWNGCRIDKLKGGLSQGYKGLTYGSITLLFRINLLDFHTFKGLKSRKRGLSNGLWSWNQIRVLGVQKLKPMPPSIEITCLWTETQGEMDFFKAVFERTEIDITLLKWIRFQLQCDQKGWKAQNAVWGRCCKQNAEKKNKQDPCENKEREGN